MLCPPLRSTLFPYTTLFRSHVRAGARQEDRRGEAGGGEGRPGRFRTVHAEPQGARQPAALRRESRFRGGGQQVAALLVVLQDRKSTRLNSSHSQISYAVFCL